jgi:mannan endo-1,4-beta-mannosidase
MLFRKAIGLVLASCTVLLGLAVAAAGLSRSGKRPPASPGPTVGDAAATALDAPVVGRRPTTTRPSAARVGPPTTPSPAGFVGPPPTDSPAGPVVGAPTSSVAPVVAAVSPGPTSTTMPVAGLSASAGQLYLDGQPYTFVSIASPSAATDWTVNWGCGPMATDAQLDAFFAALPPNSLVPFWASQAMAFNDRSTHAIDFTAIDRVFAAASRHHQLLLPELEHQQGYCSDGHWKDISWYQGGYREAFDTDGRGLEPLSYWDYLNLIVPRYRANPALGMWGLVVEPEAPTCDNSTSSDCPGTDQCQEVAGAAAIRGFFDTVGGMVKRLDPNHLISAGSIGGGQCGWSGSDFTYVNSSPGIDVCEVHDYNFASIPINPTAIADIKACKAIGKPLIVGETGLSAASEISSSCPQNLIDRAQAFKTRVDDYLRAGASGVALWMWSPTPPSVCGYGIDVSDPVMTVVRNGG